MNDKDKILAIDLINFKKLSILLTGKSFNLRADRSFGSKENEVGGLLAVIEQWMGGLEKKSNPADSIINQIQNKNVVTGDLITVEDIEDVIDVQVIDDKIEYEILESFPFGIEKIEDFGKNKIIYSYESDYYTRLMNEKAKHISYESAVNYLKSK